jgi:hypothetical protein
VGAGLKQFRFERAISRSEINRDGIAPAQQNPGVLAGSELITTRDECREGGSTSRLGNHPQLIPKCHLGALDSVIGNQDDLVHVSLGDGVYERPDPAGCKRICRDPTSGRIDWSSCLERHCQRWGGFGPDANHPDSAAASDDSCKARLCLRNETKPEGLYFGFVSEDRFDEVTRYFIPPSDQENFHVIYHEADAPSPKG